MRTSIVALMLCALAAPATADISWNAPSACPSADAVRARIAQRLGAVPSEAGSIQIAVTHERGEFVARIDLRALTVANDLRTLTARRCDDLADAVAVIVARLASEHVMEIALPPSPPPMAAVPAFDVEMPEVYMRRVVEAPPSAWGGGMRVMALSGIGAVPQVGLGAELAGFVRHHDSFLEIAAAHWGTGGRVLHEGAPARVAVGLDLAMLRVGWGPARLPIRVWAAGEVGSMSGEGQQLGDPRVGSGTWAAVGAGFGVAWPMFPNARLVGSLEVAVPIARPSFELESGDVVYRPSLVTTRVSFGLEVGWR